MTGSRAEPGHAVSFLSLGAGYLRLIHVSQLEQRVANARRKLAPISRADGATACPIAPRPYAAFTTCQAAASAIALPRQAWRRRTAVPGLLGGYLEAHFSDADHCAACRVLASDAHKGDRDIL